MPDDAALAHVDHAHGVDARLRHQQPAGGFVIGQADGDHAAQPVEAGNANRDLRLDAVGGRVEDGDGIVVRVRNEHAASRGEKSSSVGY